MSIIFLSLSSTHTRKNYYYNIYAELNLYLFVADSTFLYNHGGDGDKPILLSDLYCRSESSLLQCRRRNRSPGYHSCYGLEGNTIAVRCDGKWMHKGTIS